MGNKSRSHTANFRAVNKYTRQLKKHMDSFVVYKEMHIKAIDDINKNTCEARREIERRRIMKEAEQ